MGSSKPILNCDGLGGLLLYKRLCKTLHAERGLLVVLKYCVVQLGPKHQRLLAAAP